MTNGWSDPRHKPLRYTALCRAPCTTKPHPVIVGMLDELATRRSHVCLKAQTICQDTASGYGSSNKCVSQSYQPRRPKLKWLRASKRPSSPAQAVNACRGELTLETSFRADSGILLACTDWRQYAPWVSQTPSRWFFRRRESV